MEVEFAGDPQHGDTRRMRFESGDAGLSGQPVLLCDGWAWRELAAECGAEQTGGAAGSTSRGEGRTATVSHLVAPDGSGDADEDAPMRLAREVNACLR
ncbi:hypothetical protein GCM10011609_09090 [Lentzea pudingi]|uniref:Uncharacterized protein n=1 Tax=Lentzea pudingi TaxID=1789439 RepID=A0ABQ2HDL8_9PSEU|nr:hypothetical protein GCM10011609_09090 [Lentzea pudingi]